MIYDKDIISMKTAENDHLMIRYADDKFQLLDIESMEIESKIEFPNYSISDFAFNLHLHLLSIASKTIIINYDLEKKEIIGRHEYHDKDITMISIFEHPSILISSGEDLKTIIWDLNENRCLFELGGHDASVNCIDKNHDFIISGADDYDINIYSLSTKRLIKKISEHEYPVTDLLISPNNEIFCSYGLDQKLIFWNLSEFIKLKEFDVGEIQNHNLFFTESGRYFIFMESKNIKLINIEDYSMIPLHQIVTSVKFLRYCIQKHEILLFSNKQFVKSIDIDSLTTDIDNNLIDLFISYALTDSKRLKIKQIVETLEKKDMIGKIYFWENWNGFPDGDVIDFMQENIPKSDIFISFITPDSNESENCIKERKLALYENKKMIPLFEDISLLMALEKLNNGLDIKHLNRNGIIEKLYKRIKAFRI